MHPAVFQAETEAFKVRFEKAGAGFSELMPSELFKMDASLSEIKIGDTIFVNSTENIGTAKEFSASEIFIKPKTQTESSY